MNIILFDGVCHLCNGTVSYIIRRDKKKLFRFASIQSGTGQYVLRSFGVKSENETLYYICDQVCFQKSTAVLHILKDLGGFWRCFYPLIFVPVRFRDAVYLLVSRNRYKWCGKDEECAVPVAGVRGRLVGSSY